LDIVGNCILFRLLPFIDPIRHIRRARVERIAYVATRAFANGDVIANHALSIRSARFFARIDALRVVAHFVRWTVVIFIAIEAETFAVRIALKILLAVAGNAKSTGFTEGVLTASNAGEKI